MSISYVQKNKNAAQTKRESSVSIIDTSSQSEALQRKADMANNAAQREDAPRPNNTGMPDNLKSGIESLSGFSMDDVRVHYNSSKPATVQALAYTQGTDIHVAPGQEKHLPHEAWHVAQQMAGRVSPTTNINGMPVNDNAGLEHEADVMGEKAVQRKGMEYGNLFSLEKNKVESVPIQKKIEVKTKNGNWTGINNHDLILQAIKDKFKDKLINIFCEEVLPKMPDEVMLNFIEKETDDKNSLDNFDDKFDSWLKDWENFNGGLYKYENNDIGLYKLIKDVFKYHFYMHYNWRIIGVGEYMTGDSTGLGIAADLDHTITLKILPYYWISQAEDTPTLMKGGKLNPTDKEKDDRFENGVRREDSLAKEYAPELFMPLYDRYQVQISESGLKKGKRDALLKFVSQCKLWILWELLDSDEKDDILNDIVKYIEDRKKKAEEKKKKETTLNKTEIAERKRAAKQKKMQAAEQKKMQAAEQKKKREAEQKEKREKKARQKAQWVAEQEEKREEKARQKAKREAEQNAETDFVNSQIVPGLKEIEFELDRTITNTIIDLVRNKVRLNIIEGKIVEDVFKSKLSEADKQKINEFQKIKPEDPQSAYKRRFVAEDRTEKDEPIKPWNKETWWATKTIGDNYTENKESVKAKLLPNESVDQEDCKKVKEYKKSIGEIDGKKCILLWQRLSGLGGGAHPELDSHPIMLKQIAVAISENFPDRVIILIGDAAISKAELKTAGIKNTIVELHQYWNTEGYDKLFSNRKNQNYFLKLLSDENGAISIGMRSGSLESSALMGIKTIFIDDLGNNAQDRMEFWSGDAAYMRDMEYMEFGTQKWEDFCKGPIPNYKRFASKNKLGFLPKTQKKQIEQHKFGKIRDNLYGLLESICSSVTDSSVTGSSVSLNVDNIVNKIIELKKSYEEVRDLLLGKDFNNVAKTEDFNKKIEDAQRLIDDFETKRNEITESIKKLSSQEKDTIKKVITPFMDDLFLSNDELSQLVELIRYMSSDSDIGGGNSLLFSDLLDI